MSKRLEDAHGEIADALDRLGRLFDPRMKLTFVAHLPGSPEVEVVVTNASMADLRAVLDRSETRDPRSCPPGACVYVRRRAGGSPDVADSDETVSYCRDCGREEPGSGEFPAVVIGPSANG